MSEGWSQYNLEDGNKLRARVILLGVRGPNLPPQKGDPIQFETNVNLKVEAPVNRRGPKGVPATPEEIADPMKHGGEPVNTLTSNEPWNEYHLKGSTIRIRLKLSLNRVWRIVDRFDNNGDPVYVVNFGTIPFIES
jgi:hypothetical protein